MGSTRAQGLRYANRVDTLKDGHLHYSCIEGGAKFFESVWPAEDFDDVVVENVSNGIVHAEPARASSWRRIVGVEDRARETKVAKARGSKGFVYRLVPYRWFPPCSRRQIDKGLNDVRDALDARGRVMIYGTSRGAALALLVLSELDVSERARVSAVIAEAPYDNIANVISDRWSLPWFLRALLWWLVPKGPLDVDLPLDVPIVIGAGTRDEACPFEGQQRLAKKLDSHPNFYFIVAGGAHHDTIHQHLKYRRAIARFVQRWPEVVAGVRDRAVQIAHQDSK